MERPEGRNGNRVEGEREVGMITVVGRQRVNTSGEGGKTVTFVNSFPIDIWICLHSGCIDLFN